MLKLKKKQIDCSNAPESLQNQFWENDVIKLFINGELTLLRTIRRAYGNYILYSTTVGRFGRNDSEIVFTL